MNSNLMDQIVSLCKRRGFIFPGSEIYGGLAGTWDYGPLGVELKRNIKNEWWREIVQKRDDMVGMDAAIMMNPKVWDASGHLTAFTDPLIECKVCHVRVRADQKDALKEHEGAHKQKVAWTKPEKFNLLVKAYLGVIEGKQSEIYLRGEVTQGVMVNFKNVLDSTRIKIPFGIAQIGKAFRNEITPGNFTFRSKEFEQMEIQFYIKPNLQEADKWFEYWKRERINWYIKLGIDQTKLRFRDHQKDERAHYARAATDIEYDSPFGWREFEGIHNRGDWDLSQHAKFSRYDLKYADPDSGEEFLPWVIETSGGVDRAALFFLIDSYSRQTNRTILKLHPKLAPFKVAVFPLLSNKPELIKLARDIYQDLKNEFMVAWDDRGNIGGRYAAQDEAGTPFCVTVDFQSLDDSSVTIRDRDSAKQERIRLEEIKKYLLEKIND